MRSLVLATRQVAKGAIGTAHFISGALFGVLREREDEQVPCVDVSKICRLPGRLL